MNSIKLPWAAWYGDAEKVFPVPSTWQISQYGLPSDIKTDDEKLRSALNSLSERIPEKKPRNAVIVVDDLTRPVAVGKVLQSVIEKLLDYGISQNDITILVALGSHKGLDKLAATKKMGFDFTAKIRWINHDPQDTVPIGLTWGKTDVKLNRLYVESDFRIVVSGLTPHSFAGFSGGAKMLFPGLADMETIAKTHKSVLMGFMGKLGSVENNKFRKTIEDFMGRAGIDYFIGLVINGDRSIRNIYAGDPVEAHRLAAETARAYYLHPQPAGGEPFDMLFLNAYPKDSELLQAENAFIPLKSNTDNLLKEDGIVVVLSACSEGMGHHGLFQPGGMLYRSPRPLRFLKNKQLCFFSENISADEFYKIFSQEYLFYKNWQNLIKDCSDKLPEKARAAVFSQASLQLTG